MRFKTPGTTNWRWSPKTSWTSENSRDVREAKAGRKTGLFLFILSASGGGGPPVAFSEGGEGAKLGRESVTLSVSPRAAAIHSPAAGED